MKNATTTAKERSVGLDTVSVGNGKVGVGVIGVASILIGCWSIVCLTAGLISSGGPASLVSNFITAISG